MINIITPSIVKSFNINNYITINNIKRKTVNIKWSNKYKLVNYKQEKAITPYLIIPKEYLSSYHLDHNRIIEIETICKETGLSLDQGLSLRKQLMVNKIIDRTTKLRQVEKEIERSYNNGNDIIMLLNKYDIPPVAILRQIFTNRIRNRNPNMLERDIRDIMKDILNDGQYQDIYLSTDDKQQLTIAKSLDQNSYSNDPNERIQSENWEEVLYSFLDQNNINYITGNHFYLHASYYSIIIIIIRA